MGVKYVSCQSSTWFFAHLESKVLDPRIGYKAFRADYADEPDLQDHVDESLEKLRQHYNRFYATTPTNQPRPLQEHPGIKNRQSPVKRNWMACYNTTQPSLSELDGFLSLHQEPFEGCDPIKWWAARRQQFPNLSRLARDIFSIPGQFHAMFLKMLQCGSSHLGSSVAVERIFSGGHDTISLRRASLLPETIRVLMVLKNRLIMARHHINHILNT